MIAPKSVNEFITFVEPFKYTSNTDGSITILGNWVKKNIVLISLPILKPNSSKYFKFQCHRKIKDNIIEIFTEFNDNKYDMSYPIRLIGGFVPRHKYWNPKRSISIHSYGLALDINWDTNPVGKRGDIPDEVVELFKKHGWSWGGDWKQKDSMHLEFYSGKPF